jgi:hypothetical protein
LSRKAAAAHRGATDRPNDGCTRLWENKAQPEMLTFVERVGSIVVAAPASFTDICEPIVC